MIRVLITGATGYLASLIMKTNQQQFEFIPLTRKQIDFSHVESVYSSLQNYQADIIVHTAAMTQTANCEQNPQLSHRINVESVSEIVRYCNDYQVRLIVFSSEQVVNGKTEGSFFDEETNCQSVTRYGQDKIEADEIIRNQCNDYVLLRLSWMFGLDYPDVTASPNLVKNVMNALLYQQPTQFTVNEYRGLTYAQLLADNFDKVTRLEKGLYNFSATNHLNTYESARLIASYFVESDTEINRYILRNESKYSDRPRDYRLSNQKLSKNGIQLFDLKQNIELCLKDFGWFKKLLIENE